MNEEKHEELQGSQCAEGRFQLGTSEIQVGIVTAQADLLCKSVGKLIYIIHVVQKLIAYFTQILYIYAA